jgi:hypothetical protein
MKLDVILEKTSSYIPHYNADTKVVGGSAEEWQQRIGITKENRDEITKKALQELKKTKTWKDAEALGLSDVTTDRELKLGTIALKTNVKESDRYRKWAKSHPNWFRRDLTYVYNIYGSGQIRQYRKGDSSSKAGITRLASPKPKLVAGNPVKSLASVWENALKEVNKKYTDMLDKIQKDAEK